MYIDMPLVPGILILLLISIILARFWGKIANFIGERIRRIFKALWRMFTG